MPFKMHKIIFYPEKKYVCLPYLKFLDPLPETHFFFLFGLTYVCMLHTMLVFNPTAVIFVKLSGSSRQLTLKKGAAGDQVWDLLCVQLDSYL